MKKLLSIATLFGLLAPFPAQAQGLADVAKREKQRQAKERAKNGEATVHTGPPSEPVSSDPEDPATSAPSPTPATRRQSGSESASPRRRVQSDVARERSFRTVSVTLYVTSWCQFCQRARAFLAAQPNVRVDVHDVEASPARHKEMLSKTGGATGVPVIDVEGTILKGFSSDAITRALAQARSR